MPSSLHLASLCPFFTLFLLFLSLWQEDLSPTILEIALDVSGATAQRFVNSPNNFLRSTARLALQNLEQFGTTLPTIEQLVQAGNELEEEMSSETDSSLELDSLSEMDSTVEMDSPSEVDSPSKMDDTVSITPTQATAMPITYTELTTERDHNPYAKIPATPKPHPQPNNLFHRLPPKVSNGPLFKKPQFHHHVRLPKPQH